MADYKSSVDKPSMAIRPSKQATHGIKPKTTSERPPIAVGTKGVGNLTVDLDSDFKSCEGTRKPAESSNQRIGDTPSKKVTTLECMDCGYREVFTEKQFNFTDGLSCYVCNGPVNRVLTRPGEKIRNRRMKIYKEWNKIGNASAEAGTDIANILKGLKAIQREAKKSTAALKELEEIHGKFPMSLYEYIQHKQDPLPSICLECGNIHFRQIEMYSGTGNFKTLTKSKVECLECGWSNVQR